MTESHRRVLPVVVALCVAALEVGARPALAADACTVDSVEALLRTHEVDASKCSGIRGRLRSTLDRRECTLARACNVQDEQAFDQTDFSESMAQALERRLVAQEMVCQQEARLHLATLYSCSGITQAGCVPDYEAVMRVLEPLSCVRVEDELPDICEPAVGQQLEDVRTAIAVIEASSIDVDVSIDALMEPGRVALVAPNGAALELTRRPARPGSTFRFHARAAPGEYRLLVFEATSGRVFREQPVRVGARQCSWNIRMPSQQSLGPPPNANDLPNVPQPLDAAIARPGGDSTWWLWPSVMVVAAGGLTSWSVLADARADSRTRELDRCLGTLVSCSFDARSQNIRRWDDISRWTAYGAVASGAAGLILGGVGWWRYQQRSAASQGAASLGVSPTEVSVTLTY